MSYTLYIWIVTGEGTTVPEPGDHVYPAGSAVTVTAYPASDEHIDRTPR